MRRLKGCLFLIVVFLIFYLIGKSNGDPSSSLPTLAVLPSLTPVLTTEAPEVRSGFVTITPAPGTIYPTATITDTLIPATEAPGVTIIPTVVVTVNPQVTPMEYTILYVVSTINLRSCPDTHCSVVEKIGTGLPLAVSGTIQGEAVDAGNAIWYRVEHSAAGDEYGYSRFFSTVPVSDLKPQATQPPIIQPTVAPVIIPQATSAPSGTIICKDGYVWPGSTRQGACHGHGGIR